MVAGMPTAWKVLCGWLSNFFVYVLVLTSFAAGFLRPGFLCKIKSTVVEMSHKHEQGGGAWGEVWVREGALAA